MPKPKDLTGKRFGRLVAVKMARRRPRGRIHWHCQCDCGNLTLVDRGNLRPKGSKGGTLSCGCLLQETRLKWGRTQRPRIRDLTGQRFGKLTALYDTGARNCSGVVWHCQCDCGGEKNVPSGVLVTGGTKSCGCLSAPEDLTGQRFGRLIVIRLSGRQADGPHWLSQCDCGTEIVVAGGSLRQGLTLSCGCLYRERLIFTPEAYSKYPYSKRRSVYLSNGYVKGAIRATTGLPSDEISPAMMELKREQLTLYRLQKQVKDGINGLT